MKNPNLNSPSAKRQYEPKSTKFICVKQTRNRTTV